MNLLDDPAAKGLHVPRERRRRMRREAVPVLIDKETGMRLGRIRR